MEYDRVTKMGSRAKVKKRKNKKPAMPFSPYNIKGFDFAGATLDDMAKELLEGAQPFAKRTDGKEIRIRKNQTAVMRVSICLGNYRGSHNDFFEAVAKVMSWPKVSCIHIANHLAQGRKLYQERNHADQHEYHGNSASGKLERELVELIDKYQALTDQSPPVPSPKNGQSIQDIIQPRVDFLCGLIDRSPDKLVRNQPEMPVELISPQGKIITECPEWTQLIVPTEFPDTAESLGHSTDMLNNIANVLRQCETNPSLTPAVLERIAKIRVAVMEAARLGKETLALLV